MTTVLRPTSIEQVREHLSLLKSALGNYDTLTEDMVKSRWSYEILAREPKLGVNPDPRSGYQTVTAAHKLGEIQHMDLQRGHARDLLLSMTSAESIDVARERYMLLHSSFQRYAQLLELHQLLILDVPAAYQEIEKVTGADIEPYAGLSQTGKDLAQQLVQDLLDKAKIELLETARMPIPALTEFSTEVFEPVSLPVLGDGDDD